MGELVLSGASLDEEYRIRGLIRRIRGLPADLIRRILLDLMKEKLLKDFIKTAGFWQPWCYTKSDILTLEVLDIREVSLIEDGTLSSFCSFMDWLIECYPSGKRLKGFSLEVRFPINCRDVDIPALVTKWICFAAEHDPEYVSLDQHFVPSSMFSLHRLKSLHLARSPFPLVLRHRIDWPHLKQLSADRIWMGVEILPSILSGSPALELLELKSCRGLYKIDLGKSRLKKLVIDSPWNNGQLEITAPNLLVLCLRRYCASRVKPLKLTSVYSLVEAELNFFNDEFAGGFCSFFGESSSFLNLKKIHDQLQHVSTMRIGYRGDDVVASLKNNGYDLQELTKCKHLIIDSGPDGINLLGFTTLLERSPHLDKLVVRRFGIHDEYKFNLRKRSRGSRWDQDDEFESLVKSLKHLKMVVVSWPDAGTGHARTRTCDLKNGGEEMVRSVAQYLRNNLVSIRKEGQ